MTLPTLVAHRGWTSRYPENTLPALTAALERGARWLEIDTQLSADGIPLLHHDRDLKRTTGRSGKVGDLKLAELRGLDAGEAARFGKRFAGTRIPSLHELVELLALWPGVHVFVEVKVVSLEHFGSAVVLDALLPVLAPLAERSILISFSAELVEAARRRGLADSGWILKSFSKETLDAARALAPSLLFADRKILPGGADPLPDGPWRWVVYAVDDPAEARAWSARGVELVETNCIGELLTDFESTGKKES